MNTLGMIGSGVTRHSDEHPSRRRGIIRLLAGIALIAIWWTISWLQLSPISDYYFFPLWFGYILSVDALLVIRTGTSPIQRSGPRVIWMFVASVPLWWLFEAFNSVLENWTYHLPRDYSRAAYFALASLAFSTVIPAVLTTTELVRSFRLDPLRRLPALRLDSLTLMLLHACGWLMIAAILRWPDYAFPLVWISLIFVVDPVVTWVGGQSVATFLRRGDWSPLFNLGLATLVCGFLWEMWNINSLPKWTYDVPHVDWLHVFEMPILGYGGYIPFGIEVFIIYALFRRCLPRLHAPEVLVSSAEESEN